MDIRQLLQDGADEVTIQRMFYYERFAWLALSQEMLAVVSLDGQIMDVNPLWEVATEQPIEKLTNSYLIEYIHFDDREKALAEMQKLITSDIGSTSVTFRFLCGDGNYLRTLWNVIFSPDHSAHFCSVRDASEVSREKLESYAYKDALTGLRNRLSMEDCLPSRLVSASSNDESVVLFFIDLDGFKEVNDTFGHRAGDTLLVRAAQRMRKLVADKGSVYRLGGDEFVIELPGSLCPTIVQTIAGDVIKRLSSRYRIEGEHVKTGASLGIAEFPKDAQTMDALLECADQAMYHVKHEGKNNFAFYSDIPTKA